jgi:hypothetical protein
MKRSTRCTLYAVLMLLSTFVLAPAPSGAARHPGGHPVRKVKLSAAELAHLHYLRDSMVVGIPHRLNLADERQYGYVLDTLRRAGRSPKRSPNLFKQLAAAHATGGPGKPQRLTASTGATLTGINYVRVFGQASDGSYYGDGLSTYPADEVPYYTDVTLTLIDLTRGKVIGTDSYPTYGQNNAQVAVSGRPDQAGDTVEINALFLVAPQKGAQMQAYGELLSDQTAVTAPCQTAPTYNTSGVQQCIQPSPPATCASAPAATSCVNNGSSVSKALKVCYGNRIQSDCDYGCQGDSVPTNIVFPISGSVNLGQQPLASAGSLLGSLFIVLTDAAGGGCILDADVDLNDDICVSSQAPWMAWWNLNPAQFPNQSCLQKGGMVFDYSFQLYLQTLNGYAGVTFTSVAQQPVLPPGAPALADTALVPQVNLVQGCLPAGVKVRMADGSERAVEELQAHGDERVRSSGDPASRAVSGKTWGHEEKPLVVLRDDRGHVLPLTETHPVMTPRGPIVASRLRPGDVVLTELGAATLVEVRRQSSPAPVPVHNLRVGTEAEAAAGRTTFYANGILVGDQLMQRHLAIAAASPGRLSRAEILARLPAEWRQDYLNSLAGARHPGKAGR